MDRPRHVRIWCGGLPQRPRGPSGYRLFFLADLGLFETDPVEVDGVRVVPREVFHRLVEPRLRFPEDPADRGPTGGSPWPSRWT